MICVFYHGYDGKMPVNRVDSLVGFKLLLNRELDKARMQRTGKEIRKANLTDVFFSRA